MEMRLYTPEELGKDGYPPEWHERIKHEARVLAGDRCVRCLHPYKAGTGEWSPCDARCIHKGPFRWRTALDDEWDESHSEEDWPWSPETGDAIEVAEIEARWRILTVHHLDGNKANCRWWNLAALCQRCHLQIQGKVQMERVWPWEHSDWFKPYVAGYYAFVYRGEDLDRETVEGRLTDLLALERAA
jgi:hypothetical protein